MRFDTGSRSFLALIGGSFAAYLLIGAGVCVSAWTIGLCVLGRCSSEPVAAGNAIPALMFLGVVAAGAVWGLWLLRSQIVSSVGLARRVRQVALPLPPSVASASERVGLSGRVRYVDSSEPFSFTYGAFTPRVAVSRGLVEQVNDDELVAVLEHERYHVSNLDPLKVMLARALPAGFFYLPMLRDYERRYVAGRELAADRQAVDSCGRRSLAGALFKVVRGPGWPELRAAAAIGGPELLDVRVAQLEAGSEPRVPGVSRIAVALSLTGAAALLAAFLSTAGGADGVLEIWGEMMPALSLTPLGVALGALCAAWIGIVGWLTYRWLARRAQTDLTRY